MAASTEPKDAPTVAVARVAVREKDERERSEVARGGVTERRRWERGVDVVGKERLEDVRKLRPTLTKSSVSVHSTRLADDLGYEPRFTPEEAFARVIDSYAPEFARD